MTHSGPEISLHGCMLCTLPDVGLCEQQSMVVWGLAAARHTRKRRNHCKEEILHGVYRAGFAPALTPLETFGNAPTLLSRGGQAWCTDARSGGLQKVCCGLQRASKPTSFSRDCRCVLVCVCSPRR